MKVISLLNEKGGVGKTTLSVHIAAGLAIRGARVLLIDADPQSHATVAFGLSKEPMLHDLLVRDLPFQEAIRRVPQDKYKFPDRKPEGELLVIPSDISTRVIPLMISDAMALKDRLEELEHVIDYVIIDTSPTPSMFNANIYMCTDVLIYPTKCEYLSFDGLIESIKHRDEATKLRENYGLSAVKIGGIIPTMYRAGTQADEYGIKVLRDRFGSLVWPEIKLRTVWNQASFARKILFNFAPDTKAANEAWQVVQRAEAI